MATPAASPPVIRRQRMLSPWWLLGGAVGLVWLGLLFLFDPAQYGFYPRCQFQQMTGLDCPGCGGLRAAHQMLHGHFRAAFALNPLLVVLSPVAGWMLFREVWRLAGGRTLVGSLRHPAWVWALAVAVVVFGIARNLPWTRF